MGNERIDREQKSELFELSNGLHKNDEACIRVRKSGSVACKSGDPRRSSINIRGGKGGCLLAGSRRRLTVVG
jgi:hypothetical protein